MGRHEEVLDAGVESSRRGSFRTFYLAAGVALLAYSATLLLRPAGRSWPLLDDWGVDGFELLMAVACLISAYRRRPNRGISLALGLGLLAWAIGDIAWTIESLGGATPPIPSIADGFYLALYPFAYLAVMLLLRTEVRRFPASVYLDGVVAGLGAAAVCASDDVRVIVQGIHQLFDDAHYGRPHSGLA